MTRKILVLPALALAATTIAAYPGVAADEHIVTTGDQLAWEPVPPALPPGAELAVLSGDPSKEGQFVIRIRAAGGYKVPPHWHSTDEHVTVLSGTLYMGMGDNLDTTKGTALPAGGYAKLPAKMHHYAWATGDCVIEVHAAGPFDITYVHPEDNPEKQATK